MGSQSRSCRARERFRASEALPDPQHRAEAEAGGLRRRLRCGPTGNNSRCLALVVAHPRGRARQPPARRLPTLFVFPPHGDGGQHRPAARSERRGPAQVWADPRRAARWDHQARLAPPWPVSRAALHRRFDPGRLAQRHLETRPLDRHCLLRRVARPKVQREARSAPPWPVPQAAFPQCLDPGRRSEGPAQRSSGDKAARSPLPAAPGCSAESAAEGAVGAAVVGIAGCATSTF